jgi:hypothetical protein
MLSQETGGERTDLMSTFVKDLSVYGIYPSSVNEIVNGSVCMARMDGKDVLLADERIGLIGESFMLQGSKAVKAELTHENACIIRKLFPFTAPVPALRNSRTMGVGDRLGIATEGHIRVFEKYESVFPVFAQQSIRELNLTGRTYDDVLDAVTFAVFKHGYRKGFGADGDHLKTPQEVQYALSSGYTMITLDCSEYIRNDVNALSDKEVDEKYESDAQLEALYIGRTFTVGENVKLYFPEAEFKRMVMIYGRAIDFICRIYNDFIAERLSKVDLEVSIDETSTPTTPLQHYFIANELLRRGVHFVTIAPRFIGEFQKGIDYIGDVNQFQREFEVHAVIARHFGYKLSIHSGSAKFSIFPAAGRLSKGVFHIKTAGTSWLEAMCLIARKAPSLYREIHKFALQVFSEAKKYYHVTTDLTKIPDIDNLADDELPSLFHNNDARQLIHITYGLILSEVVADGRHVYRDRLYSVWHENEETYSQMIESHIGRHLDLLLSEVS